jgi:hypothetical protein
MAATTALPDQLIYLIIRFTASLPDLSVSIKSPRTTPTLSLKQLIRQTLPFNHAAARLRLIYAGKVLADSAALSNSLRLPAPPPRTGGSGKDGTYNEQGPGSKSKGKQAIRDPEPEEEENRVGRVNVQIPLDAKRYYIHCSLGDALSPSDLASEATLAQSTEATLRAQYASKSSTNAQQQSSSTTGTKEEADSARRRTSSTATPATTTPTPQGFDRLLTSGFTAQEISTLRTHFTTNLSYTHTPDTMPSPTTIRRLEDAWLDSTATDPSPALTTTGEGGAGENGWVDSFTVEEGGLDDMLWGYLTGFFWPLGGLVWGFREEGVWTRRRQVAVVTGVVINAVFGFIRWSQ